MILHTCEPASGFLDSCMKRKEIICTLVTHKWFLLLNRWKKQQINKKNKKKASKPLKFTLNPYFGIGMRIKFSSKTQYSFGLNQNLESDWMGLVPILNPFETRGQFNHGFRTLMKPLSSNSTWFPKLNPNVGRFQVIKSKTIGSFLVIWVFNQHWIVLCKCLFKVF